MPLFEFAIRSTLAAYDLETAEGRIAALREAAPIVAKIRDTALRPEYSRRLAGWLGVDVATVARAVQSAGRATKAPAPTRREHFAEQPPEAPEPPPRPTMPRTPSGSRRDPALVVEREALKCALQQPEVVADWYASVEETAFTHPTRPAGPLRHRRRRLAARRTSSACAWIDAVLEASVDDSVRGLVRELAVEPLPAEAGQDARYAVGIISRLLELDASRRIDDLQGPAPAHRSGHAGRRVPAVLRRPPRAGGVPAIPGAGVPSEGRAHEDHAEADRRGCPGLSSRCSGIGPGERVVAWGSSPGADATQTMFAAATDKALYLQATGDRLPWDRISKATWNDPMLELVVVDEAGQSTACSASTVEDARDLPAAVHDRVTASVLVSERVDLGDGAGALMVARRAR